MAAASTPLRRLAVFAAGALGLLMLVAVASNAEQFTLGETGTPPGRNILAIESGLAPSETETPKIAKPVDIPESVVIAFSVVLGIGLLYLLSRQRFSFRFRRPSINLTRSAAVEITEEEQAEQIADFARDLIDELNDGDSPRYAIQRAYAAVETGFGATELTRKPAETPLRYLDRIFGRHARVKQPLEQLTHLFQRARFSSEPVDEDMRASAIEALTEIRDYYTAISWKRISNRRTGRTKSGASV
ncbi:MAG: hypothetical protein ACI9BK_001301 [Acidimicrobiales bacterium]